jgi:MarR family transcriptional regulator, organic hydroperoxide resistance regulator
MKVRISFKRALRAVLIEVTSLQKYYAARSDTARYRRGTDDKHTARPSMDDEPLHQIAFYIGRAYYSYVGWLETLLTKSGLDQHLRPGMGQILCALYRDDDLSIKQIATQTQLSQSTLTGMLVRMERAGLIDRRRDERDGRLVRIRLTRLGRSLEADFFKVAKEVNEAFLAGLGKTEVARARRLLKRLIDIIRKQTKAKQLSDWSLLTAGERK